MTEPSLRANDACRLCNEAQTGLSSGGAVMAGFPEKKGWSSFYRSVIAHCRCPVPLVQRWVAQRSPFSRSRARLVAQAQKPGLRSKDDILRQDAPIPLSATRRRTATAIRWLSIPLAAFAAIAPLWSAYSEYRRTEGMVPTTATVLDAHVVSAARVMSEWEAYVRYPVRGAGTENSVRVWTSFDLHQGDTITLLVDPATGDAKDDKRAMSWLLAAVGLIVAAFMLRVGFGLLGAMLRSDRRSRQDAATVAHKP
jgi:hypothetical protein